MDINSPHVRFALCLALCIAAPAFAHSGPRVWVAAREDVLVTQTSDYDDDPSTYTESQVFAGELSPNFGTYATLFPGFEAPRDGSGGVPSGASVGFRIAGPLLTLSADATSLIPTTQRFADVPAPQLEITFPDVPPALTLEYTRRTSGGVITGYAFTSSIEEHVHLAYTFLGDGASSSAAGPDGVYVLPLVLTSPSLATTDWFFLTFGKNAGVAARSSAFDIAQVMASAPAGDANFDHAVNFDDLLALARNYGTTSGAWWARGDFDFDGAVNFDDLLSLARNYGGTHAAFEADWSLAQSIVPEPLLGAPLLFAFISRRRRA